MITLRVLYNENSAGYEVEMKDRDALIARYEYGNGKKYICADEGTVIELNGPVLKVLRQGGSYICTETDEIGVVVFLGRIFKHMVIGDKLI